jgi:hypothetical protein
LKGGIFIKNIKKYILGFFTALILCITSLVGLNDINNKIVVNAQESSEMVYVGTPVNPLGTYDKLYFNTNLTNDEVLNIIKNLDFIEELDGIYFVYCVGVSYEYVAVNLNIIYVSDTKYGIMFQEGGNDSIWLFSNGFTTGVNGWRDEALGISLNPLSFENNSSGLDSIDEMGVGFVIPVGQQNVILNQLISSTPFEYASIEQTELVGTAINPTGTYDNIYFNESITFNSLKNIFDNLSYTYDLKNFNIGANTESCYGDFIIINESMTTGFFFSKTLYQGVLEYEYALRYLHISNGSLGIADLFAIGGNYGTGNIYKSIPNFYSNPLLVEITGVGALMGISIGQQNEQLKTLISSMPFYRVLKPVNNTNNNKDIVKDIFETGKEALTGLGGLLTDGVNALVSVFYINNELTIVGVALAIGAGVGVLYFLFKLIKNWLNKVKGG